MKSHLEFKEKLSKTKKTKIIDVVSNYDKSFLGIIKWYGPWRSYTYFPNRAFETLYSWDCLKELSEFIQKLNIVHKKSGRLDKV